MPELTMRFLKHNLRLDLMNYKNYYNLNNNEKITFTDCAVVNCNR